MVAFPLRPHYTEPKRNGHCVRSRLQVADIRQHVINGRTFLHDYRDVQGYIIDLSEITENNQGFLSNQGDAEHTGAELEVQWSLSENLSIAASGGLSGCQNYRIQIQQHQSAGMFVAVEGQRPYCTQVERHRSCAISAAANQ